MPMVRSALTIPLAVKVGPFYSAFANVARRLADAGADGIVCFNRFLGPDIDLETLTVEAGVRLSTPDELRLPLRWIAILYGHVKASLALTTGIHSTDDAVKAIMAGAAAFARLYLLPVNRHELPAQVRVAPAW